MSLRVWSVCLLLLAVLASVSSATPLSNPADSGPTPLAGHFAQPAPKEQLHAGPGQVVHTEAERQEEQRNFLLQDGAASIATDELEARIQPRPTPTPSAAKTAPKTCVPKPYNFGPYTYCQANFAKASSYPTLPSNYKLRNLQLFARHGDRVPVNILPDYSDLRFDLCDVTASLGFYQKDAQTQQQVGGEEGRRLVFNPKLGKATMANPYAARLWQGNCMTGQLTSRGVQQLHDVGAGLREVYVDKLKFLPETFYRANTSFYLRSTDVWRTRQSAESLLTGLWPTSSLSADTIPFDTYPSELETMTCNALACPAIAHVRDAMQAEAPWFNHLDVPQIWKQLDDVMGTSTIKSFHSSFSGFYDNLQIRKCHNIPYPCSASDPNKCVSNELAEYVFDQGDWEYQYTYLESPRARKYVSLGMGAFFSVVRDLMEAHVTGDASISSIGKVDFAYYSAHDTSLGPALGFLNITGFRWPPYASTMLFELIENTDESAAAMKAQPQLAMAPESSYYVRLIYNGEALPLYAAGCCEGLCPYTQFKAYLNKNIPENLVELCSQP